jgi:hypothetical protein
MSTTAMLVGVGMLYLVMLFGMWANAQDRVERAAAALVALVMCGHVVSVLLR